MEEIKKRTIEVLENGYLMSLGTLDDGGVWVSDVLYVLDDNFNLYWLSSLDTRHSKAIIGNSKVACSITITNSNRDKAFGVQISGSAYKVNGIRQDLAIKHFLKKKNLVLQEGDERLNSELWYVLKPDRIELIDEENLGFKKKIIDNL